MDETVWSKDEIALIDLAAATAREGNHVAFLATILLAGPLWHHSHAEITAAIKEWVDHPPASA